MAAHHKPQVNEPQPPLWEAGYGDEGVDGGCARGGLPEVLQLHRYRLVDYLT